MAPPSRRLSDNETFIIKANKVIGSALVVVGLPNLYLISVLPPVEFRYHLTLRILSLSLLASCVIIGFVLFAATSLIANRRRSGFLLSAIVSAGFIPLAIANICIRMNAQWTNLHELGAWNLGGLGAVILFVLAITHLFLYFG